MQRKLPPPVDRAVERTPVFRRALGLPPLEELMELPELRAADGRLTADEYLAIFGDRNGSMQKVPRSNAFIGPPKPRHLYPSALKQKAKDQSSSAMSVNPTELKT